jgi:GNAT superfamily N-acetyltransferase
VNRPPRRVPFDITHTWESQVPQYSRPDVPREAGINHWVVPAAEAPVPIECLLYRNAGHLLLGILNYYPQGSPLGELPHDFMVIVHPRSRRQGIGKALLEAAVDRWPDIDLMAQCYTDAGWELAQTLLVPIP